MDLTIVLITFPLSCLFLTSMGQLVALWNYQEDLLRPWQQKLAVFRGQYWRLDPPFTCADKDL